MNQPTKHTYAGAGVNIDLAMRTKENIARLAQSTYPPQVLSGVGFFGGLYEFKGYKNPVLVSHADGVGTKLRIALALGKHDSIGRDIVNHCVNDIFTCGAEPLFFLDYIGTGKLSPERVEAIVTGLSQACREVGCALIGGETAEMPGIYNGDDYDLVGFIVGVVEKDKLMMGKTIVEGDVILGLPSSGLHTNGFSLVRKLFGESKAALSRTYPELGGTIGEAMLEPHRCYYIQLKPLLPLIKGLAHITGGSFFKNIPRILPAGLAAHLDSRAWNVPPLFRLIQQQGNIDPDEMYHVFNMGIGMAIACSPDNAGKLTAALPEAKVIGKVVKQAGKARVVIDWGGK
ncbi:MAG: phosphoribosylformylglycinamidine cyclo-ligase [Dehalococcoidales bacterium]|nr:phosphoribosylformylglycinamidine cyclo-ligase [Dehalococcoidales bacterium]